MRLYTGDWRSRVGHDHSHKNGVAYGRAFAAGIVLNAGFVIVEIIAGLRADSTALLADAGHNAGDVVTLLLAWGAAWLATARPRGGYTYGFRRATILVSMVNAMLLVGAVFFILREAWHRFQEPLQVQGLTVMAVAGLGVVINTITAFLFIKGQHEDLNVRGAFLHMAADAAVSVGVVVSGALVLFFGLHYADPVASVVVSLLILYGTWGLLSESIRLALDGVPVHINIDEVHHALQEMRGVEDVHDLHVWAMSTTETALTVHLVVPAGWSDEANCEVNEMLYRNFGISHVTIQIENDLQSGCTQGRC